MDNKIRIEVQVPNPLKSGEFKVLFRNVIDYDPNIKFDFEALLKGIKILFDRSDLFINLLIY